MVIHPTNHGFNFDCKLFQSNISFLKNSCRRTISDGKSDFTYQHAIDGQDNATVQIPPPSPPRSGVLSTFVKRLSFEKCRGEEYANRTPVKPGLSSAKG